MHNPIMELEVAIKIDGIKTAISIDIYPEKIRQLPALRSIDSSNENIASDQLVGVILPTLKEVTPRLIEVNQIVSGNLEMACCELLRNEMGKNT